MLENLHTGGRLTVCQPQPTAKSVAAHLQALLQLSTGNGLVDCGKLFLGEGHTSFGSLSAEDNEYSPIYVNVATLSLMTQKRSMRSGSPSAGAKERHEIMNS